MSPAQTAAIERPRRSALLLLVAICLFWGLNWPVIKLALGQIPVLPFRALCLLLSAPPLLAIAALRGDGIAVSRQDVAPLALTALFNVTLWHLFTGYGVSSMPAGRASIIAYTMPAWAVLLGAVLLNERLTGRRIASLVLGMGGIGALLLPDLRQVIAAPLGAFSMILAAIAWAAGTVAMKRHRWTTPMATLTGWQICIGGLPILVAAALVGPFPGLDHVDAKGFAALAYVVIFAMVIGQWAWFAVLARLPLGAAAISTLATPVIGVLSSALLLGEGFGAGEIVALALVVAALGLALFPAARR